jgi:hypothetical protein
MINFRADRWVELVDIFGGRLLKGERGTNKILTPGWNKFETGDTVTLEELEQVDPDNPAFNLGIRTGRGLVVVDIDKPEKEPLIRGIVGESNYEVKTPRGKHLYFRTDPEAKIATRIIGGVDVFSSPDGDSSRGSYVVAPGSIRTAERDLKVKSSGKARAVYDLETFYGVSSFDDISYREPEVILELMATLGNNGEALPDSLGGGVFRVSSVKLPHSGGPVEEGGRNNAAASLFGQYLSRGLSFTDSYKELSTWNECNPEPLPEAELHRTAVSVFKADARNNPEKTPVQPTTEPLRIKAPRVKISSLPAKLHTIPGALGDLVAWYMDNAPAPHIEMAVQSALALGSVVLGRKYVTSESNFTSLYFLTVAKSGTGKEFGKKTIERLLESAGLDELIGGSGYTSPGAVFSSLKTAPTHVTIIDEFGKYLAACSATGNSQLNEAVTTLIESFGRLDGTLRPRAYSSMSLTDKQQETADRLKIVRPAVTLYAMTTPRQFYSAIGEADIEAGMLGRFLVMSSDAEVQVRKRGRVNAPPPAGVVRWAQNMRRGAGGNLSGLELHDKAPSAIELEFTPAAYEVLDAFEVEIVKRRRALSSSGQDVLLARALEVAMRVSAIIACSKVDPRIDRAAVEWAVEYVKHCFYGLLESVRERVTGSEFGARRQAMLEAITLNGERGLTDRELKRRFRALKPREHAEVIRALADSGEVALAEISTKGRTRHAYVAVEVDL